MRRFISFSACLFILTSALAQDKDLNVPLEYDSQEKALTVYVENRSQSDILFSRYTEVNENGSSLRIKSAPDEKGYEAMPFLLFENGLPSQRLLLKAGTKRYCKFPALKSDEYQGKEKLYFTLHLVYAALSSNSTLKKMDIEKTVYY